MRMGLPFKLTGIAGLLFLLDSSLAWADVLPGAVLPEQVGRAITQQQPQTVQQTLPPLQETEEKPEGSPLGEQATKIKFKLNGVELKGNHIYSTEQLSSMYRDKLHKEITVAQLFEVVQAITNYYRNNGYIITRAILPPQHVKGGVVTIQVIEGYLGKVDVTGDPKGAKEMVMRYAKQIQKSRPLQVATMEKYLLLANEIPGTEARAVLSPSQDQTGAADLSLATQNKPLVGYMSYDNYGTRYIGPQQMTGSIGLNSFITSGDSIQGTVTKTPKGAELTYNDLNYSMPIDDEGRRWQIGGTRTRTQPLFVLAPQKVDGINKNYYTSVTFPVIRTRTRNLTLRANFNYLDSNVDQLYEKLYTDHVRSLGLGATLNFSDSWYGANMMSVDLRQGLPIFGYSTDTNPETAETSRPGGNAVYTKLTAQMSRLQAIKGPISLYGQVNGQLTYNVLLASEQYSFGGSQMGRGYDPAELIGDRGFGASVELRYDLPINKLLINSLQFYVFYDGGIAWNLIQTGGTPLKNSATSTGIGARFFMTKYISGNFMWTQPLTKQVAAEELIGNGKLPRVFFSVVGSFG